MFKNCAMPFLRQLSRGEIVSHSLRIFGQGESAVEDKLRDMMNALENPTLAPYAKEGEVMLRVTAKADTHEQAEKMMEPVIGKVRETLGSVIYGVDVDSLEETVSGLLRQKGLTLAAAESCTGGLLAKRMTDLPGATAVFRGGVVVYSNESKTQLLGVPAELIEEQGPVCQEVARELACRVREKLGADLGVGITGLAGPDDDGHHAVGTVFVGLATPEGCFVKQVQLGSGRERIRIMAANHGLDMARRWLTALEVLG